jgi:cysteinyl-tRNA synthetase
MKGLDDARSALGKLERGLDNLLTTAGFTRAEFLPPTTHEIQTAWGRFLPAWEKLCDDLNVPGAFGEIFKTLAHPAVDHASAREDISGLAKILYALGITPFAVKAEVTVPANIRELAEKRWAAKQAKDFQGADTLRNQIVAAGWTMLDRKDGYDLKSGV